VSMNLRRLLLALGGAAALMLTVPSAAFATTGASTVSHQATASATCRPADQMTGSERAALKMGRTNCKVAAPSSASIAPGSGAPVSAGAPAAPAAGSVDSSFSFCNTPKGGPTIACFLAELHYVSRTEFRLNTIQLEDRLCDARSSYADVYTQDGWTGIEYVNNQCNTTVDVPETTHSDSNGIQYVQIRLYACNSTSCSSAVNSLAHYNPYW
jgi:hypothetical protein